MLLLVVMLRGMRGGITMGIMGITTTIITQTVVEAVLVTAASTKNSESNQPAH